MKAILPKVMIPLLLAVSVAYLAHAVTPDSAGETASPSGSALLQEAAMSLYQQPSIAARISQRVNVGGHELVGTGAYQQLGSDANRLLKMELKIQVAGQLTSLQQVCDGRFFWVRKDTGASTQLSRIDLRRFRDAIEKHPQSSPANLTAHWMRLGGLPKLVDGLATEFDLGRPQPSELGQMPVWVVEGRWKPEVRRRMLEAAGAGELPEEFPEGVVVVLGRDDLFPYRVQYYRDASSSEGNENGSTRHILLTTELFEVRLGAPIDPFNFIYKPGDQEVVDRTDQLLRQLGIEPPK